MSKLIPWRGKPLPATRDQAEPNPAWALAVGLVYVFRTAPGAAILRELEAAVRRYARDPAALWALVHDASRRQLDEGDRSPEIANPPSENRRARP